MAFGMTLDWNKVAAAPEKDWKVVGQLLIDHRNKIEALEKELEEYIHTQRKLKDAIAQSQLKIKELENQNQILSDVEKEIAVTQQEKQALTDQLNKKTEDYELKLQHLTEKYEARITQKTGDYEAKIQSIKDELEKKTNALQKFEDSLKTTSEREESLSMVIDGKNQEIAELKRTVEEKTKSIEELNQIIGDKNDLIERLSQELTERKDESLSLIEKVKERDSKIQALTSDLEMSDQKIQELEVKTSVPVPPPLTQEPPKVFITEPTSQNLPPQPPLSSAAPTSINTPSLTTDLEWRDTEETLKILKVQGDQITEVETLNSNEVGIIIDKPNGTIWVWKGQNASRINAIRASTKAPSYRSGYRLYDWKIEFIDQGEEPEIFPLNTIQSE